MYCSQCGKKLDDGVSFCSSCGCKVGQYVPSVSKDCYAQAMILGRLWTLDKGYVDGCYYKQGGMIQKRTQVHVRVEDVDAVVIKEIEMSTKKKAMLIIGAILATILLTPLVLLLLAIVFYISGTFSRYRFVLMIDGQEDISVPLKSKEIESARMFAGSIERERNFRVDGVRG